MRHVRLDELSGSSLAEQVILAVHLHGQKKKRDLRVGTRRLFLCLGRVFFPWLVMMLFEDGAAATLDTGSF